MLTSASACYEEAPPITGRVGVTLDASGDLAFAVVWCAAPPDGLTVYHDDDSNTTDPNPTDAMYHATGLGNAGSSTFSTIHPEPLWRLYKGSAQFADGILYVALPGVVNQRSDIIPVDFRPADVKRRLRPGQVLFQLNGETEVITSAWDFLDEARAACRRGPLSWSGLTVPQPGRRKSWNT